MQAVRCYLQESSRREDLTFFPQMIDSDSAQPGLSKPVRFYGS
jgi:hypothetical protein